MLRKDPVAYKKIVRENVEASKRDIPAGFTMPESSQDKQLNTPKLENDEDFWNDSSAEESFGVDSDLGETHLH